MAMRIQSHFDFIDSVLSNATPDVENAVYVSYLEIGEKRAAFLSAVVYPLPYDDHGQRSQREKQQGIVEIGSAFEVERRMWPYHEENGQSSTEYDAKKARTARANRHCNNKCWPERNERDANNIRIDRERSTVATPTDAKARA
jgi:hypothetical protein